MASKLSPGRPPHLRYAKGLAVGVLYGLLARMLFTHEFESINMYGLMSFSFLFVVPFITGLVTAYVNEELLSAPRVLALSMPLFAVLGVVLITLLLQWEGIICVLMALPVFACMSLLGGYIGIKLFHRDPNKLGVSLCLLLPFALAPLEAQLGLNEKVFTERTSIVVQATEADVWRHITRVHRISEAENRSSLFQYLGFPRPLEARLDTVAIGGVRTALFDRGLFFTETVTELVPQRVLGFTIAADPDAIPPSALDEHVLVGGRYFDVLYGRYELVPLNNGSIRLELTSRFKLSTRFNFYSGLWSQLIMRDIQENILGIVKRRAEGGSGTLGAARF